MEFKKLVLPFAGALAIVISLASKSGNQVGTDTREDNTLTSSDSVKPVKVIIKLDDLGAKNGVTSADPVLDILMDKQVKACLGVIGAQLDSTASIAYARYLSATNGKAEKLFEIFNHGWDHSNKNQPGGNSPEFKGTPYAFQKEHLKNTHDRVKRLLGIEMYTFGAPFNASDSITTKVLTELGYQVFLYSYEKGNHTGKLRSFNKRINIERTTGNVDYEYFVAEYEKNKQWFPDYFVIQGHPNLWDETKRQEFIKILDYLEANDLEAVLPLAYYEQLKREYHQ